MTFHQEDTNFQNVFVVFFNFFFQNFQFHFQSKYRFSLTFKEYDISVVPKLMFSDSFGQILNLKKLKNHEKLQKKGTFDFLNLRFTSLYHKNSSNRTDFY